MAGVVIKLAFIILVSVPPLSPFCQEAPATMTRIEVRLTEPESLALSFAGQPKTYWRAGTKYARVAETSDSQNHIHGLFIVNEPDAWLVNLYDKSGRHIIDPGPSLVARLPLFQKQTGAMSRLNDLEFGMELDFFVRSKAEHSAGEIINGNPSERYHLLIGEAKLLLWVEPKTQKPLRVSLIEGKQSQTYQYLAYDNKLLFDAALFEPPSDVKLQESR